MRCPFCAAPNRAGASFCIECGEPLDAASLAALPARGMSAPPPDAEHPAPRTPHVTFRIPHSTVRIRLGWELALGLGLLIAVLGADAFSVAEQTVRDTKAAALRRGVAAMDARRWVEAQAALRAADDYADARLRLQQVEATLARLRTRFGEAEAAVEDGAWWAATFDYTAVAALQQDYESVGRRLAAARAAAGPILYRRPGVGAHLWWANADGSDPRPIPGTDEATLVHATSPDGRWVIYSDHIADGTPTGLRVVRLIDLRSGRVRPLVLPPGTPPGVTSAQFRADGSGLWGRVDDQLFYADLTGDLPDRVPLLPCAPGIVARDLVHGVTLRLTSEQPGLRLDTSLPLANGEIARSWVWENAPAAQSDAAPLPGNSGTTVWVGDPWGRQAQALAREPGAVADVSISPDGAFITYRVITFSADGRSATDTWVLFDRRMPPTYPGIRRLGRQVIAEAPARRNGRALPALRARFQPSTPDTPTRLLFTQLGAAPWLYDPATGRRQTLALPADTSSGSWQVAPGPYAVSLSGQWFGLEAWSPAGPVGLSRLVVQPVAGGDPWSLLVPTDRPTWLGFSSDDRYAFYSLRRIAPDGRHTLVVSVPTPDGQGGPSVADVRYLIDRQRTVPGWTRNVALTPDGRRVLALITRDLVPAAPGAPSRAPGLYGLRPDGTDWLALVPGATEFWVPGALYWSAEGTP